MINNMKKYSYNEQSKILETGTTGTIKIDDIFSHYAKIYDDGSLPRNLKVLIDCRDTHLDVKANEISLTKDIAKKTLLKFKSINEAIIVDKPNETVVATIFEHYNSDLESYRFEIFSTENGARNWLSEIS